MEIALECKLYPCSLGTGIICNLKVFASLPTRSTQEIPLRGLISLAGFPFSLAWQPPQNVFHGDHLLPEEQITCLCMQAIIQDPFPGC